ncbi:MAG: CDC27 family protein, partial [bacterium]
RLYETKFDSLLNLAIKLSEKAIKRNKKEGRNYFYLGSAYGSRSIYYAQRGKWLAAFKDGAKVLKNFNKAVAYSPDFYDAYYGLGLYKYWLCAKSKLLRFLPFSKDNRREGIEQIKMAIEKGQILNVDAMHGLTAIYYNEGEFEKALQLSDQLYELYPNNPSLLYRRGRIYQKLEKWNEAIKIFEQLYDILKFTKYQSVSYQIECLYHLAKSHYQLENYIETQRFCQEALMLEKFCDFSKELDGPLEKYSAIKDQLHKLNKEVKSIMLTHAIGSAGN